MKDTDAQRLLWAGHIPREPDNSWAKPSWKINPQGQRPPGQLRTKWRGNIEKTQYHVH